MAADDPNDFLFTVDDDDDFLGCTESMGMDESCYDTLMDYSLGCFESHEVQKHMYAINVESKNRADMQLKKLQFTLTRLKKLKSFGSVTGLQIEAQDFRAEVIHTETCLIARKKRNEYLQAQLELAKSEAESSKADMAKKLEEVEEVAMAKMAVDQALKPP